uniref:Translation initiation factor IF2/IF5 domain-containing protein n=1 Tax=Pan troglodytes TaxID=9598 RepID=A0A2I3SGB3_PANTR
MSVNVNPSMSDQFYYKMPCLIAKVEGKGNGIKTVIVNMTDTAKALNWPPRYPTKYFGGIHCYIVNGSQEANKLQDILDGLIKKFVLCPECENPETDMHVKPKQQTIGNSYKACGYRGMLDTHHKLCTFILKNPPENSDSGTGKKEKEKKNIKGKDKENGSVSSKISPTPHTVEEEEDDWGEDTTEEAQRCRMDEISDHAKVLILHDDLEKTVEERANILFDFGRKRKKRVPLIYLISKIPNILKEMYDVDFLEEEVVISWSEKELAKEIRVKEAEEESSGGEEDEDENIEKTASVPKVETVKSNNKDDDIDIDAI